jgi:catalase
VLNKNPANYFAEVEQLAFAPSHLVPGIEPSPDKMLQGRLFSYSDTHRHRLGVNYQSIPVNCPFATKVRNYQRDGNMTVNGNQGSAPNYFPNSFGGPSVSVEEAATNFAWHKEKSSGDITRFETGDEDNFTQAGLFYRNVLDDAAKERLTDNIANNLVNAQEFIQNRTIANFSAADVNTKIKEKIAKIKENKEKSNLDDSKKNNKIKNIKLSPPRNVLEKSNL